MNDDDEEFHCRDIKNDSKDDNSDSYEDEDEDEEPFKKPTDQKTDSEVIAKEDDKIELSKIKESRYNSKVEDDNTDDEEEERGYQEKEKQPQESEQGDREYGHSKPHDDYSEDEREESTHDEDETEEEGFIPDPQTHVVTFIYEDDLTEPVLLKDNIFERAKDSLHLDAIPDKLPGREGEKAHIQAFLEPKINLGESGGTLYIAGMPGTGKTATVKEIIKNLQVKRKKSAIKLFRFIEINCMQLSYPDQLYQTLYSKLQFGRRSARPKTSEEALRLLKKRFNSNSAKKDFVIVLVDEFDCLLTKKEQTVIYNLFEWPNKPASKFVVIAISNTMNLPDQLSSRVKSRMGLQRLPFQPYNTQQLESIIKYRLGGLEAFDQDSIQLVAKRVATVCGDARRALEICRKAATIALQQNELDNLVQKVTDTHIDEVFKQFSLPIRRKLNQLSLFEKLFLYCVCKESKRINSLEVVYGAVYRKLQETTLSKGMYCPTESEILQLAGSLGGYKLILFEDDKPINWDHLLKLNISQVDLFYGLEEDEDLQTII
ncbi:hypothetical protein DICPUDRAFT_77605 [Dictyostelium purpureum]|uniref:Origin recognition complex subunit 1 n=1 Tax=Dictyostelium purpureum TaxID=5786 RepID=F0ZH44_DICPU|nr:uncharacterized protein DICPUDRAFT_77605 [Dictyostelium purpureum]EGC36710.1 hypothetical protein DICPUDRAFT_77605 [Dictyostelium purpureum]|eukprot:XP_003286735.1 hypothetical protein DICPUDRAFT_77605 [Dictyostelium purpureum]